VGKTHDAASTKNTRETRILERTIERGVQQRTENRSAAPAAPPATTTTTGGRAEKNHTIDRSSNFVGFQQLSVSVIRIFTNLAKKIKTPKKKSREFF
jgi:hypothetical protein